MTCSWRYLPRMREPLLRRIASQDCRQRGRWRSVCWRLSALQYWPSLSGTDGTLRRPRKRWVSKEVTSTRNASSLESIYRTCRRGMNHASELPDRSALSPNHGSVLSEEWLCPIAKRRRSEIRPQLRELKTAREQVTLRL